MRRWTGLLAGLLATGVLVDIPVPATSATVAAPAILRGTSLTTTSLGLATQIGSVDMTGPRTGYAVAAGSTPGVRSRFYLVRTSDAGTSWTVAGELPYRSFTGPWPFGSPVLDFVSPSTGYVTTSNGGSIFVTDNGGGSWSKVSTPGIWPTFAVSGSTVWAVSDMCQGKLPPYGPLRCPSVLSLVPVGEGKPVTSFPVPAVGVGKWRAAVALASPGPSTAIVQEGGTEGGASSLLETSDAGRTWRTLKDPCEGLMIQQLLTPSPSHWLLSCFMGGGMTQGTNKLWSSSDGGRSWFLEAYSTEQRYHVGNIADTWNTLAVSGNGRLIFSAVGGAAGGMETSADGGRQWTAARFYPEGGGAPEFLSAFGPNGAIFGVQSGGVWRTLDGVRWAPLRLAAGPYRGDPVCTARRGVAIALRQGRAVAGISWVAVAFTNRGPRDCYLNGVPVVQPVSGPSRSPVGPAADQYQSPGRGSFVVLRARGGRASSLLGLQMAHRSVKSCRASEASGVTVEFSPPADFYVSLGRHPVRVCTTQPTYQVTGIVTGVVPGPS